MPRDFQRPFTLPAGATEIVCVRHGSSAGIADGHTLGLVDGHSDPPLSDRGHVQADAVAQRLRGTDARRLFITPLRRTAQTAEPLARVLDLAPVVIEELREVHLGEWEGQLSSRMGDDPVSAEILATGRWDVIPDAEDMDAFSARITAGMARMADAVGPDGTGVAVLHGGVIAEACRQATDSLAFAFLYAENASITRLLRLDSGRWALRTFNDIAHLTELAEATR
ncbi:histidine phosphatase family protein [Baekduia soli]|nr:histidine phosphatase family protein [Baekduia soli]